jgi:hypothetical protein
MKRHSLKWKWGVCSTGMISVTLQSLSGLCGIYIKQHGGIKMKHLTKFDIAIIIMVLLATPTLQFFRGY